MSLHYEKPPLGHAADEREWEGARRIPETGGWVIFGKASSGTGLCCAPANTAAANACSTVSAAAERGAHVYLSQPKRGGNPKK